MVHPATETLALGAVEAPLRRVARARVPGLNAVRLIAVSFGLGVVVALSVLLATGAWPVALIVSIGVAFLPYAWVVSRVAGRAKTVRAAWPEVIDAMVSGVRAGTSPAPGPVRSPTRDPTPFVSPSKHSRATTALTGALNSPWTR